jgi:C4-dicarboxylate transporter, DctM subunit
MTATVVIAIALFLVLAVVGVPVAFAVGMSGIVGLYLTYGDAESVNQISRIASSQMNFLTVALPLYVLFGELLMFSGAGTAAFRAANAWLRRIPGGLGVAIVGSSAVLAAVTGATTASINTFGPASIKEAAALNYPRKVVLGALASSGTLGILIPPSISMIFYSSVTGVSLGKLFEAGFLPGIVLTTMMAAYIVGDELLARRRGERSAVSVPRRRDRALAAQAAAPARPLVVTDHGGTAVVAPPAPPPVVASSPAEPASDHSRWRVTLGALPGLIGVLIVLGTIYTGFATPTESAGIGVVYALALALATTRRGRVGELVRALWRAAITSSMMMFLVIGAQILSQVAILQNVPQDIAQTMADLNIGRWGVLVLFMLAITVLGCLMNPGPIILITMPIVYPVVERLGFDGVWFGIIVIVLLEFATLHPPVGINLYVVKGVANTTFGEVVKAVIPYWFVIGAAIVLFTAVPSISLWLPSVLR